MNIKEFNFSVQSNISIIEAMKLMDILKMKLLLVAEGNKYEGLVSIGDIQRAIIRNLDLDTPLFSIIGSNYIVATPDQSVEEIKRLMLKIRAEFMPVVDEAKNILHVYFWNDFFVKESKEPLYKFNLPIVIMAGGMGSRLRPLTYVLPKPLIPVKKKTFLEEIFDRFNSHGCDKFYISVNYRAELIEYYIEQLNLPLNLNFFREDKPMGTGGSLSLLKGEINETFFVSNCDILIDQDYSEVLNYHRENANEITIIAVLKHYPIAYGTVVTGENGKLLEILEKPEITIKINSGMYILEPHVLDLIPQNQFLHITQLIESARNKGCKVGVFPVSENSWQDIGEWKEYMKVINIFD